MAGILPQLPLTRRSPRRSIASPSASTTRSSTRTTSSTPSSARWAGWRSPYLKWCSRCSWRCCRSPQSPASRASYGKRSGSTLRTNTSPPPPSPSSTTSTSRRGCELAASQRRSTPLSRCPCILRFRAISFIYINTGIWPVLRSQSRKEPELLAGAGAETLKFRLRLPALGQLKYLVNKNKNSYWTGSSMSMRSIHII